MTKNAYIHIPFCKSKCNYCSFISYTNTDLKSDYIAALIKEIKHCYNNEELDTFYFGGGTPSMITINNIEDILNQFKFSKNCEITFEINPEDANFDYLKELYKLGINRISMGAQSFDNNILKLIGRRHTAEQTILAVKNAQKAGFNNINLDLIYGLPGEYSFTNDLIKITALDIQHISTYGLKIEEGSYFYKNTPKNLPDDDKQADLYIETNQYLEEKGYLRYEISNFAKKNYESKHNLNYWNNNSYYGFGVAAHGYLDGIRYGNKSFLKDYIKNPTIHEFNQKLTLQEKLEEEIFLGFRKTEGINIEEINTLYNIKFELKYKTILNKFLPKYIEKTLLGYKLTLEGILLSNHILSEFLE